MFSTTKGIGATALDQGLTYARYGTGLSYKLNGLQNAPDNAVFGAGSNLPVLNADGSGYKLIGRAASGVRTVDSEQSLALDGEYSQASGIFNSLAFGARHADHRRDLRRWAPAFKSAVTAAPPASQAIGFPADFGSELGGNNWDNSGIYFPYAVMRDFTATQLKATTPEFERRVASEIEMTERQTSCYSGSMPAAPWRRSVFMPAISRATPRPVPSSRT
ncbi:hypothetical protein [Roseateles sp.]|uniref:hypothetical protein n=1 Tax=Roseateles sp. TaxID=1971397 RepID=UPI00286B83BB|nr:hypothetical protein [Roseateles sp.]